MEDEKKKRKNKKKKNKQTKGIENNVGAEESASSNQNHPAKIRGSEAHTDDTSGIDDDPNRHDTGGAEVSSLAENEKHGIMDTEATSEEKIKQLQKDKVAHMQKEAILEEKLKQLSEEKDASLLKESNFDERIKELQNENNNHLHKKASFEEKIVQLQEEIISLRRQEANQEEKIRQLHMEKDVYLQKEAEFEMKNSQLQSEKNSWLLKEKSLREIISSLSGDNALLETQVKEFEDLKTNIVQENQLLKANIEVLQTQVNNLEKSAGPPCSPTGRKMNAPENGDLNSEVVATQALVDKLNDENAELVEKVKNLYVELERRGPPMEVSSFLGSDIITTSSEEAGIANESGLGSQKVPGAVHEHEVDYTTEPKFEASEAVLQSGERLQSLKDTIDKAASDHEHMSKIHSRIDVNSSGIESDEIVQIPLDENEVQSADLEPTNVDQEEEEEVPLTSAPLIGAPFRLISFVARYVSGADLVDKNAATSNQ